MPLSNWILCSFYNSRSQSRRLSDLDGEASLYWNSKLSLVSFHTYGLESGWVNYHWYNHWKQLMVCKCNLTVQGKAQQSIKHTDLLHKHYTQLSMLSSASTVTSYRQILCFFQNYLKGRFMQNGCIPTLKKPCNFTRSFSFMKEETGSPGGKRDKLNE